MSEKRKRWYLDGWGDDEPQGVFQIDTELHPRGTAKGIVTLPEHLLRLAQTEYERQCGCRQDYERMQQRGGLSLLEVVRLLADYVERLGGKPSEPRAKNDAVP